MTDPRVKQLAKRLDTIDTKLRRLSRVGVGLGSSSIEDGAVNEYTLDGQLVSTIGKQVDGTHGAVTLVSPKPLRPLEPTLESVPSGVLVSWGGEWEGGVSSNPGLAPTPPVAPLDFQLVEVHVSTDPAFTGLFFGTKRGEIVSARGGQLLVPTGPDTPVYARLVARTVAGRASDPSDIVGPVSGGKLPAEYVDIDLSAIGGGTTIWYGADDPTDPELGDLWLKEPEHHAYRLGVSDLGSPEWIDQQDTSIVQALEDAQTAAQAAGAAQEAATQAGADALAAHSLAESASDDAAAASTLATQAQTAADSKITVYRQATAPSGGTYKINGDLWIDSDDGLVYYASTVSGGWLATPDQRIATALTNAATADGKAITAGNVAATKTTVFAQISQPSTTGRTVGDIWIDTDDGNSIYDWSTSWTKRLLGAPAINATARQLGGITVYYQTSQPASGMVSGDLWIDTDDGNKLYAYTTSWLPSQDTAIQTALTNAQTANTAVATKITVFTQTSAPTSTGRVTGDIWIDTSTYLLPDGVTSVARNATYTWNGSWTSRKISGNAIQPGSLVASDVIATGTVSGALLKADAIDGTTITGATFRTSANTAVSRIVINGSGITAYGSNGSTVTTTIDAVTGQLTATGATITGILQTAASGPRATLSQNSGWGALQFFGGQGNEGASGAATFQADTAGTGTTATKNVRMFYGTSPAGTYGPLILMQCDGPLWGNGVRAVSIDTDKLILGGAGADVQVPTPFGSAAATPRSHIDARATWSNITVNGTINQGASAAWVALAGCTTTISVPAGRTLEMELRVPGLRAEAAGGVNLRLVINGNQVDETGAIAGSYGAIVFPTSILRGSLTNTGTTAVSWACSAEMSGTGAGGYAQGGAVPGGAMRYRYRLA